MVFKYSAIIENKKTDATSNEDKTKAWSNICLEFNACCGTARSSEQLKKYYYNQKKALRKRAAEERKEAVTTGKFFLKLQSLSIPN